MQWSMQYKKYEGHRRLRHLLSTPFIWLMIVPIVIMDIFGELYHRICFPLYGIECVKRKNYIRIDRHKLSYLNLKDKLSCMYCGYANGFLQYACEIAARTEKYWCGIKHKQGGSFIEPKHHKDFLKYGDKNAYAKFCKLKK
jgi:hypothetical protein